MSRLLWTLKQHVGPRPRIQHASAYDSQRNRVVLFGGDSLQSALLRDTWEWDGENWTQVDDIGPAARFDASMVFDEARKRIVLFGGRENNGQVIQALDDTWEWDGSDWIQVGDTGPSARSGHAMVFDAARGRVVLFGGAAENQDFGDTWQWDGNEWVQVEHVGPPARRAHAMTFDAARGRIVLFGGLAGTSALGDTWEFDGTAWTEVANFGPPPCFGASLVYNGRRAQLFGGASGTAGSVELFRLTWEWDGHHWTARQDFGPQARWGHAMVFDAKRKRGVLFGGTSSLPQDTNPTASGETWEQFEEGAPSDTGTNPPTDGGVSGTVLEPLTLSRVAGAVLRVENQPNLTSTSDAQGNYSFPQATPSESFAIIASTPGSVDCRTDLGPIASTPVHVDAFMIDQNGLSLMYTTAGQTREPGNGTLIVDLRDEAGHPRGGIPLADILLSHDSAPVAPLIVALAPVNGGVDPQATTSIAAGGHALVAFLNVPPNDYTVQVNITQLQTLTRSLRVNVNRATFTQL